MKKQNYLFLAAALMVAGFTFNACKKDNGTTISAPPASAREIPVDEIKNGVTITGGTLKTGSAPAPNSNINFEVASNSQSVTQNSDFEINFKSTANITKAYLQLKDASGNKIDGYYEVPVNTGSSSPNRLAKKQPSKPNKLASPRTDSLPYYSIDANVAPTVAAGTFCYSYCVVDDQGNISQVQTVCVTIASWGGNPNIVGEWVFEKNVPEMNTIYPDFDSTYVFCNGSTAPTGFIYELDRSNEEWLFVLNADGTYYETYKSTSRPLNDSLTQVNCTAVYDNPTNFHDKYSGNWSSNTTDNKLYVVDYKHEDLINPANNYDYTNGSVYLDGQVAVVVNNKLVITDTWFDNNNNPVEVKTYFKRK